MTPLVIRPFIVARALTHLREQKTHPLFAGYLYLQQRAVELGRLNDLRPEFLQFYKRFFEVPNHPLGTPYIKIFTEQQPSERNLWLNENVAGSYAPSSRALISRFVKLYTSRDANTHFRTTMLSVQMSIYYMGSRFKLHTSLPCYTATMDS